MLASDVTVAEEFASFVDAAPSPFHVVAAVADRLDAAGFMELHETEPWSDEPGGRYVRRSGSIVAWTAAAGRSPEAGWSIVGAHTDSPNLRIKPKPDLGRAGFAQLGVEVYGGVLLNSWLDRDLGVSGRIVVDEDGTLAEHLVLVDRPVLRVPQLAIHLDREIHENGLKLNRQQHMAPIWSDGPSRAGAFQEWIAEVADVPAAQILAWDLMVHDLTPSARLGADGEWLAAPRIDNQASCHAGLTALLRAHVAPGDRTPLLCLFDHEEVGSVSRTGAGGNLLPGTLSRLCDSAGASLPVALANSACISADGAHATHPNYVDRHEPQHRIELNAGPVIKRNANERYATDAIGHSIAEQACRAADVPHQVFVNRTDLGCGSTIGPITSAQLGITTVDLGMAQLSMHSARELCGVKDPGWFAAALTAFMTR